ncbi:type VII secretion protein EccB [Mycolicibacterium fortuitum]|uniref:type VII secretion protein EccB n=1 Tax=Mycolicibacterium fortuitum TaxID=1766 RepID=UPI0026362ADE|nr:type VII secretion protein EccB [Mycolicibacterium fortuitum]
MAKYLTTKTQLSGYRLIVRRVGQAMSLRDTQMLSDPFSPPTLWGAGGIFLACGIVVFSFLLGVFNQRGADQGNAELILTKSGGRYVMYNGTLHEATNLASARLIVNKPDSAKVVKDSALEGKPRGQLMGIPSAPENLTQRTDETAQWTVCDRHTDEGELSLTKTDILSTTLFAGLGSVSGAVATLAPNDAVLVKLDAEPNELWMVYKGQRTLIGPNDLAARAALALSPAAAANAIPISEALFNAIPAAPALTAPFISERGVANPNLPNMRNGDVIVTASADGTRQYHVALVGGVQQISELIAQLLINTGSTEVTTMDRQQLSAAPLSSDINLAVYPERAPNFRQPHVVCWQWQKGAHDQKAASQILTGEALPVNAADQPNVVKLQPSGNSALTADASLMKPGAGWFVYITNSSEQSHTRGAYSFIADTGIRYPIGPDQDFAKVAADAPGMPYEQTVRALGLTAAAPLPIPWEIAKLYGPGSTLSRPAALTLHPGSLPDDLHQKAMPTG